MADSTDVVGFFRIEAKDKKVIEALVSVMEPAAEFCYSTALDPKGCDIEEYNGGYRLVCPFRGQGRWGYKQNLNTLFLFLYDYFEATGENWQLWELLDASSLVITISWLEEGYYFSGWGNATAIKKAGEELVDTYFRASTSSSPNANLKKEVDGK